MATIRPMTTKHPLERYRKRKKLSRGALADEIGVDRTTIWRWENGTRVPDRSQLAKVAAVTGASFKEILSFRKAEAPAEAVA